MDVVCEPYTMIRDLPLTLNSSPVICNAYMRLNNDLFIRAFQGDLPTDELLIVHPGTDRLLASVVACAAFAGLFCGEVNIYEYYSKFSPGELVVRGQERFRFHSIEGNFCVLTSDDKKNVTNSVTRIPLERGLNIRPYSGSSSSTGTRGSGRSLDDASKYLQQVVGDRYRNQAIVQPLCTLVVCSKEKAQYLVDNMIFEDGEHSFRFADVFPIAWARSIDDIDFYCGESGKSSPTLLFTNRISLAREILYDDEDTDARMFSIIIDNIEASDSLSEIDDIRRIISSRNNGRIVILQSNDKISDSISSTISGDTVTVVWSAEVLLSTIDDLYHKPNGQDDRIIMNAINRLIDNHLERVNVKSPASFSELKFCRTLLHKMIKLRASAGNTDAYILCAYGLLNLFEQAAFTMDEYERHVKVSSERLLTPQKQVEKLSELAVALPAEYREDAQLAAIALEDVYNSLVNENPKRDELLRRLKIAQVEGKTCVVAVPKRSYLSIIAKICSECPKVRIELSSRLSGDSNIDYLIVTATQGRMKDGRNPLSIRSASETILLEYATETSKNDFYQFAVNRYYAAINRAAKKSAPNIFGDTVDILAFSIDGERNEVALGEAEILETQLEDIEVEATIGGALNSFHPAAAKLHAVCFVQFDTGEWALFSQYYAAYVLDERENKLIEKSPVDLMPGDVAIFSASGEDITDFVDDILQSLIRRGNVMLAEHYDRSIRWKKALKEHMQSSGLSYRELSEVMNDLGHPRHAVTIASWLREDSVIVGPRDADAFIAIGLAANDNEIADNAELYKESCDYIRRQRVKILNYVQASVVQSVAGNNGRDAQDSLSRDETSYLGDIQKYARKLIIERVVPCERDVPVHIVNRPVGGKYNAG